MAETQVKGQNVGDRSITHLDIDLSAAPQKSPASGSIYLAIVDPGDSLTKIMAVSVLETYFNTKYALQGHFHSGYEPALGNPSTNGYVLSSTTAGVRTWVAMGAGGGYTQWILQAETFTGSGASFNITNGAFFRLKAGSDLDISWSYDSTTVELILNHKYPFSCAVLASTATTTSTTGVPVAGLSLPVNSGVYIFEAELMIGTDSSTTGCSYGVYLSSSGSATGTIQGTKTATTDQSCRIISVGSMYGSWLTAATLNGQLKLKGIVRPTASGSFTVKFGKTTSGTATILQDSYMKLTKIG